jgi:trimethylamine--corrinoid protein Co-methyltransferase
VPEKTSLPWKNIRNSLPPIEPLSTDEIESIHQASLRVLAELGMKVTDTEARKIYAEGGARVDRAEEMVYLDPEMVEEVMALAPAEYTLNARNSDKSITIGGNHITFSGVAGPAFVSDLDRGRRPGTYVELCDYKKLFQSFDIIHYALGGFEPLDLPENSRHLDILLAQIRYTDKCISTSLLGSNRARDGLNMACILFGIEFDDLPEHVVITGNINTNSPRLLDGPMFRRIDRTRQGRTTGDCDALHTGRCDGSGDRHRRHYPAECRGISRHCTHPVGATRRTRSLWWIHFKCGYAHWFTGVWNA